MEYNESGTLNLVPGKYSVAIASQDKEGYIISNRNIMQNVPGYGSISVGEDIEYSYIGSATLDNSSGYWVITENQLRNTNKVRFYLFRLDKAEDIGDIGETGKIDEYSKRFRAYIEPQFLP